MSIKNCPADEMGQAYEYLVGKFADDAGNTAQEFYTNRTVVELMTEILQPKAGESIYDPTCGTGGMLISCIAQSKKNNQNWQEIRAFGQEQNALTSSVAKMNLFLHGIEEFRIINDDTLLRPGFLEGGKLKTFDIVLANPPYSIKKWNREYFANDPFGRNFLGVPPQGCADFAFLQHIFASMDKKNGRCAILLPKGILNRIAENKIRSNLISLDIIDTIISLGKNLFFNSPMEACVMICQSQKPIEKKGKILFIEGRQFVERKDGISTMTKEHINIVVEAYNNYKNIEHLSYIATIEEIQAQKNSLSVSKYVVNELTDDIDLNNSFFNWEESSSSLNQILDSFSALV